MSNSEPTPARAFTHALIRSDTADLETEEQEVWIRPVIRGLAAFSLAVGTVAGCGGSDSPPGGSPGPRPDGGHCVLDNCAAASANCGKVEDGCNGVLECGTCKAGETCGAAGPNICGVGTCTKTTCAAEGKDCGLIADGCGDLLDCGKCTTPKTCGGGKVPDPNVCG